MPVGSSLVSRPFRCTFVSAHFGPPIQSPFVSNSEARAHRPIPSASSIPLDKTHFAPPNKPWLLFSDGSTANSNQWLQPLFSKWCEMDFVHPQYGWAPNPACSISMNQHQDSHDDPSGRSVLRRWHCQLFFGVLKQSGACLLQTGQRKPE